MSLQSLPSIFAPRSARPPSVSADTPTSDRDRDKDTKALGNLIGEEDEETVAAVPTSVLPIVPVPVPPPSTVNGLSPEDVSNALLTQG